MADSKIAAKRKPSEQMVVPSKRAVRRSNRVVPGCVGKRTVVGVYVWLSDFTEKKKDSPKLLQQAKSEILWWAARWNNVEVVEDFLRSKQGDPQHKIAGLTALHRVVAYEHVDVIRLLLEARVSPNAPDDFGLTPLFWGVAWNRRESIALLLSKGANKQHCSPWDFTNNFIARLIDDRLSRLNFTDEIFNHFWKVISDDNEDRLVAGEKQFWKNYLLWKVTEMGDMKRCKELLSAGANVIECVWIVAPIHQAVLSESHGMLLLFLDKEADPDAETGLGMTPLGYAARRGHTECVKTLLRQRANPSYDFIDGTPLELAKNDDIRGLLLKDKKAKHCKGISIKDSSREVCDKEAQQNQENVSTINYYFSHCKNIVVGDSNRMTLKDQ